MRKPFFWVNSTQFFDTFNNNFFRTALTSFIMFEVTALPASTRSTLAALAVALLMFPTFLVSTLAGELSDKYPKDRIIRIICLAQFFFVLLACAGFKWLALPCLFIALFGMGAGGAMLSPVKYSILPEILPPHKLLLANGLMQATVYMAILGGTILGGMIFSLPVKWLYSILLGVGVLTAISGLKIPKQAAANSQIQIDVNFLRSTFKNIVWATYDRNTFFCILAVSWFWGIGTVVLSQIPALVTFLGGKDSLFTLFIVLFSCGIGVGSLFSQVLLKGKISAKYSAVSLLLVTCCLGYLTYLCHSIPPGCYNTLREFFMSAHGKQLACVLFLFSVFGGVYIVPLVSLLQMLAPAACRARIIAANNIINALFMVGGSLLCSLLLWKDAPLSFLFALLTFVNVLASIGLFITSKNKWSANTQ